jgi:uncharacterized protein (DUF305 family)
MRTRSALLIAGLMLSGSTAFAQAAKPVDAKYTKADVEFMQDMIHHHAQIITLCDMAETHRASAQVLSFCKRAVVSQRDEIEIMTNWLRTRGERFPEPEGHSHSLMEALEHSSMPGMLSPMQMRQLNAQEGVEFDRLFLTNVIRHHEGALTMVKKLFASPGAGQGSEIFAYATGVDTDQRAEIERLKGMLAALPAKK